MPRLPSVLSLVSGVLVVGLFWPLACASDPGVTDGIGGSGGDAAAGSGGIGGTGGVGGTGNTGNSGGSGGGWPTTGFGSPCSVDEDCGTRQCTDIGKSTSNRVCTVPCVEGTACPGGGYCAYTEEDGYTCIPDTGNQCGQCSADADCPNVGDVCLISANNDRYCARDCAFDGRCGTGFECVLQPGVGPGDPDAGDSGTELKPAAACVPEGNESCACDAKREGVARRCSMQSGGLTCEGTETCNAATGNWEGCTASSPQPEICDGADNDCNGTPDDGTDLAMCAHEGDPANTSFVCTLGQCELAPCESGWAAYPASLPKSVGCTCRVEAGDIGGANDTCAGATHVGSVSDGSLNALTISGRLTSDSDVDWYKFDTIDTDETSTNSYHIQIDFTAPVPANNEFMFDVVRGEDCAAPAASHSSLTSYTWCVDGTGTGPGGETIGEQVCSAGGDRHCGPHGRPYYLRVARRPGATGTCDEYRLTITARGSFNCDFTQDCAPQVDETGQSR